MMPIHMVPTAATAGGLSLAASLLPSLQAVSKNLTAAIDRCSFDADGMRFHTNPAKLDGELFEDAARAVGSGKIALANSRHGTPKLTSYEHQFFRTLLKNAAGTIERLGAEALAAPVARRFENAWMFCEVPESMRRKAHVEFARSSPLPLFFGLALAGIAESVMLAAGIKNPLSYEKRVADQVGIGAATALRVYQGIESLTNARGTLLPHKIYRVEDMSSARKGDRRTARIYIASSYLPVLYSSY